MMKHKYDLYNVNFQMVYKKNSYLKNPIELTKL